MSASGGDGYKRSLFDKHGPEAAHHFQRATSLVIPFVAGALIAGADDVFTSNRLVDLYLAWPGHEMKGLRELRRLIDTYPETDVAKRARAGLVNLKSQLGIAE